ncbi:efflux transporter, RND family, MFP subunit [Halothece sp. PCC 7418]|uniref:efflux RND transporter periplasmic adaptor subunit n=1 Tax=Halothece sp. (strain PCC 7418) TaxID=65093 RepID=UPI0002A06C0D|nr:efflux RND transporter periplasmic adaptor subunit [Halothece sp. PCC 7418]AFZ45002.1 efflux transporter, RND family, MFP subunit [Halothece sp. PCC 7418]
MKSSDHQTFWGLLLLIAATSTGCSTAKPDAQASSPPPIPVAIETLSPETLEESSQFVGNLEATEKVALKPEIQGRIQQMRVAPGDRVAQGEAMMVLEPDQTLPQLENAQAGVNAAIASRETAVEKRKVAQSQRDSAQEEVNLAQVNYDRAQFLLEAGAIGQFRLDQAETELKTQKNRLQEAENAVEAAQAAIRQAEANLAQARAQVKAAQVSVGFKQILSPISGIVGDLAVKQGDYITPGETIATITRNNFLDLEISVPARRSGELQQGMTVELLDPASQQTLSQGKINFISPNVETTLQTIPIKARFPNSGGTLRDGQRVEAKIVWNNEPGILIPTTAISRVGSKSFVFVQDQPEASNEEAEVIVRQRPIQLGEIQGSDYQVLDGLEAGDQIAVSNILKLRDGAAIQPQ